MAHLSELEVYAKTVYEEARNQGKEGQQWVAWVIKNRNDMKRDYWGHNIKEICLRPGQFKCWNGKNDIDTTQDAGIYKDIYEMCRNIYLGKDRTDPTGGCDHFNNPRDEGYPDWTNNCDRIKKIKDHQFYKSH